MGVKHGNPRKESTAQKRCLHQDCHLADGNRDIHDFRRERCIADRSWNAVVRVEIGEKQDVKRGRGRNRRRW